jgi:hypothetical protein
MKRSYVLLVFLVLLNSCDFVGNFPLSIDDIDTLSVYRKYQDSLIAIAESQLVDTIELSKPVIPNEDSIAQLSIDNVNKWTICKGTFKLKENAKRRFTELSKSTKTYVIIKDSLIYVTTGIFNSKDSADVFIGKNKKSGGDYPFKITSKDKLLSQFPE